MRLTVNLDDELYAIARSLAKAEDCSVSEAVNRLVRKGLRPASDEPVPAERGGFPVVRGTRPFTSEDVYRIELEDA